MQELKRIDIEAGKFTANGINYTIEQNLSIERYAEFQILEKEMAYGLTTKGLFARLKKLFELINKMKFAEASVMVNDLLRGVSKLEERQPTVLKICALFINADGENRATINKDMIEKKINDWKAEGLSMNDFFTLAASTVNGFLEIYKNISQLISEGLTEESQGEESPRKV